MRFNSEEGQHSTHTEHHVIVYVPEIYYTQSVREVDVKVDTAAICWTFFPCSLRKSRTTTNVYLRSE